MPLLRAMRRRTAQPALDLLRALRSCPPALTRAVQADASTGALDPLILQSRLHGDSIETAAPAGPCTAGRDELRPLQLGFAASLQRQHGIVGRRDRRHGQTGPDHGGLGGPTKAELAALCTSRSTAARRQPLQLLLLRQVCSGRWAAQLSMCRAAGIFCFEEQLHDSNISTGTDLVTGHLDGLPGPRRTVMCTI